ncbi:AtpZ/AtpI family protein [uncultured Phenylobacterium sp.]|uniref:AtpZ/AtpI family protein n=1 Tax=uncultured Phenylobacterium sp. TaxID=349273 RepID=UPI0025EC42DA|nr:AtpZ/AtpI family protein [uncultured Phenylobacterium sp.]
MPTPVESHDEARKRLSARMDALEAERAPKQSTAVQALSGDGFRFLGEVVGGVLGGTGLGWVVDRFANTQPLGLIGGLLIGTGFAIFVAVRGAAERTKKAMEEAGPLPSIPDDEND